jgi:outer membrane protein OmpA-like peptidoglycan-associated protein
MGAVNRLDGSMTFVDTTRSAQAEAPPVMVSWDSAEDVSFERGRSDLMPRCGHKIQSLAAWVRKNPSVEIALDAHADLALTGEADPGIATRRVKVVRDALVAAGVPAARIHYTAFHAQRAVCTQDTPACQEWNRRVEVFLGTLR